MQDAHKLTFHGKLALPWLLYAAVIEYQACASQCELSILIVMGAIKKFQITAFHKTPPGNVPVEVPASSASRHFK